VAVAGTGRFDVSVSKMNRAGTSSRPEDIFVDLFSQVFGVERTQLLAPEFEYTDFDENRRLIDFALKTIEGLGAHASCVLCPKSRSVPITTIRIK